MPKFGLHESNVKYIFCWALEKAGIESFRTEVSLPIYPQAPHLRGPTGKLESVMDLAVEMNDLLIGFEFKTDSLSRISEDSIIAYKNNLSCTFFTGLEGKGYYLSRGFEEIGKPEGFWLYGFEKLSKVSESFGLLTYDPTEGLLSILKKPLDVKKTQQHLHSLSFNKEDELKYRVWKNLKRDGYMVISEPKPKHVEYSEEWSISAPSRRKYIYPYSRRVPKVKRIDFIAVKRDTIGVEVKSDLKNLRNIEEQLKQYLNIYDLNLLYLAVPIHLVREAEALISTKNLRERVKILIIT
ncbi:MAG: hypothetical protein QXL27_09095 [Candidatus Bathyarchaeia archaeon]